MKKRIRKLILIPMKLKIYLKGYKYSYTYSTQIDVQKSINDPIYDCKNNIIGTLNILEACKKYKIKNDHSSSAAVYGQPNYLPVW
ncbi:MAG: GDP-mannose 4,6-dehydratase [Halanaerobiales bacterium]|nr:GDP-mannose 4,6-dehydratase [Halanaerobiales bacterium]